MSAADPDKAVGGLGVKEKRLLEEIDGLRHELRHARDDLERMSGPRHALERRVSVLVENIRLCERELAVFRRENQTRTD